MDVSENSGFSLQIIHGLIRVFHYKPSIFGVSLFLGNTHISVKTPPQDTLLIKFNFQAWRDHPSPHGGVESQVRTGAIPLGSLGFVRAYREIVACCVFFEKLFLYDW